jgi:hypothetical protein
VTEADVNLAARLDSVGTVMRQKRVLDRVSEVLCDGWDEEPASAWRWYAEFVTKAGVPDLGTRLRAIADLVEQENRSRDAP